jgi:hypothetical protein
MIVVICTGSYHPSNIGIMKCCYTLASDKWRWSGCGEEGDAENAVMEGQSQCSTSVKIGEQLVVHPLNVQKVLFGSG